jgi:hypothetical protein
VPSELAKVTLRSLFLSDRCRKTEKDFGSDEQVTLFQAGF